MVEWKSRIPALSGDEQIDMRRVLDYTLQLSEEMRYHLNNLGVDSFDETEWAQYTDGLLKISAERLELAVGELEMKIKDVDDGFESKFKASAESFEAEFLATKYLTQENAENTYLKEENFQSSLEASAESFVAKYIADKYLTIDTADGKYVKEENFQSKFDLSAESLKLDFSSTYLTTEDAESTYLKEENFQSQFEASASSLVSKMSASFVTNDRFDTQAEFYDSVFEQHANQLALVVNRTNAGGYVLNTASIVAGIEEDDSFIDLVADTIDLVGLTRFYSSTDEDENEFKKVEIYNGEIYFDSGWLADGGDGNLWLCSNAGTLTLEGSSINLYSYGEIRFAFYDSDGDVSTYWVLDKNGLHEE